ncbi:DUF3592 domain-containing protein [Streptomyces sp. NPDC088789]|uniref:DUF3592 domain-containing protein n=1 Tax=Streptomyces sp. NPDC088789 TaxID=3365899 RepID=UPI003823FB7F
MGWYGYLALWCAVFGSLALIGYVRSLAGMTRPQRMVRVRGRIERVREPRHGGSRRGGISVVVSYPDPATGQDVTVTNDGERGEAISLAWPGREVEVSYPRGRPHAFRLSTHLGDSGRGLCWPYFAVFLMYVGAVVAVAIERGWPWALIGFCGALAVLSAFYLPENIRDTNRRIHRLSTMTAVPGRVVAVLKDVSTDEDGHTATTLTPVVAFTTADGRAVTAHITSERPDLTRSYGHEVTVHHVPDDPAVFTLDRVAEHRSQRLDVTVNAAVLVLAAAAAVLGAVLL